MEDVPETSRACEKEKFKEKKRKKSSVKRRIELEDFPLGRDQRAYNLLADVKSKGPSMTWPQLLHLSPTMRCQWSRMVSTKALKNRKVRAIKDKKTKDIVPLVEIEING